MVGLIGLKQRAVTAFEKSKRDALCKTLVADFGMKNAEIAYNDGVAEVDGIKFRLALSPSFYDAEHPLIEVELSSQGWVVAYGLTHLGSLLKRHSTPAESNAIRKEAWASPKIRAFFVCAVVLLFLVLALALLTSCAPPIDPVTGVTLTPAPHESLIERDCIGEFCRYVDRRYGYICYGVQAPVCFKLPQ